MCIVLSLHVIEIGKHCMLKLGGAFIDISKYLKNYTIY